MKRPVLMTSVLFTLLSGAAPATLLAFAPRPEQMPRVQAMARDLEQAAREVYDAADSDRNNDDVREEAALRRLYDLQSKAYYFRRTAETYGRDPDRTEDEFQELVSAYTAASAAMDDLHARRAVLDRFGRVDRIMDDLSDAYGGRERFWGSQRRGGARGARMTLPAGTPITVVTTTQIRSRDLEAGEVVGAELAADLVVGSTLLAPRGAEARMRVREVDDAGRVKGKERLVLELTEVEIGDRIYPVEASDVTLIAEDSTDRDVGTIAGGAAIGALIGAITGGGDAAAKGAAIGGAAGTGVVLTTKGKSVKLDPAQPLTFTLEESVRVRPAGGPDRRPHRGEPTGEPGGISRR